MTKRRERKSVSIREGERERERLTDRKKNECQRVLISNNESDEETWTVRNQAMK